MELLFSFGGVPLLVTSVSRASTSLGPLSVLALLGLSLPVGCIWVWIHLKRLLRIVWDLF